jgi:hypothetical protein
MRCDVLPVPHHIPRAFDAIYVVPWYEQAMAIIITMDPVGAQTRQLLQDAFTQGSVNLNLAKRALKDVPDEIGMLTILET